MEFPTLGDHCCHIQCKRLDFLPMKCDGCMKIFCSDHIQYTAHDCFAAHQRDVQIPVCPLCNQPVVLKRDEPPDIRVSEHMDKDCKSDLATAQRGKIYKNQCTAKGCKKRELVPITCSSCRRNFCLKHRFESDHECPNTTANRPQSASQAAVAAQKRAAPATNSPKHVDSIQDSSTSQNAQDSKTLQEANDEALAQALAISEQEYANEVAMRQQNPTSTVVTRNGPQNRRRDNCCVS